MFSFDIFIKDDITVCLSYNTKQAVSLKLRTSTEVWRRFPR